MNPNPTPDQFTEFSVPLGNMNVDLTGSSNYTLDTDFLGSEFESVYGEARVTTKSTGFDFEFDFGGTKDGVPYVYGVDYTVGDPTLTSVEPGLIATLVTNPQGSTIIVAQDSSTTIDQTSGFLWVINTVFTSPTTVNVSYFLTPVLTPIQVTIPESILSSPRIQITITYLQGFQDIASVAFDIDSNESFGCACGSYKQLIGPSEVFPTSQCNKIMVASPFITCYLAGEGYFSTEKMASVNGTTDPVWSEVFVYAMTKFILNRLLNCVFDLDVLYTNNTKAFLDEVRRSKYSKFIPYFIENRNLEKYFLCSAY